MDTLQLHFTHKPDMLPHRRTIMIMNMIMTIMDKSTVLSLGVEDTVIQCKSRKFHSSFKTCHHIDSSCKSF